MRSKLLLTSFALFLLLGVFHAFSTHYYLYWTNSGTDHVTHIIGSAALGVLGLWLCYASGLFDIKVPTLVEICTLCILIALVVGAAWEAFEYNSGIVQWSSKYPWDTFGDMVSDAVGGVLASIIGSYKKLYV